jgi:hypothetical protein
VLLPIEEAVEDIAAASSPNAAAAERDDVGRPDCEEAGRAPHADAALSLNEVVVGGTVRIAEGDATRGSLSPSLSLSESANAKPSG